MFKTKQLKFIHNNNNPTSDPYVCGRRGGISILQEKG